MLKSIKYYDVCQKFHRGINRINNNKIVDIAITSFGGFTDAFSEGVGRRVEINDDVSELSVNSIVEMNNSIFHFTRCYTKYRFDTEELDKKQDIVKYAKKLDMNIDCEKNILPIIAYYNELTDVDNSCRNIATNNLKNRGIGYSNCLIVKNKFDATQEYFKFISFIIWQKELLKNSDILTKNYHTAMKNISIALNKIGYDGIAYDLENECVTAVKNKKNVNLGKIRQDLKIYIAIIFDLNMRCLMLNPTLKNPFFVDGTIGITYNFENNEIFSKLVNFISKEFPKIQILI